MISEYVKSDRSATCLVASEKWVSPHEGMLTILLKVSWANIIGLSTLQAYMRQNGGRVRIYNTGREVAFGHYLSSVDEALGNVTIRPRLLMDYSKIWGHALTYERLRYCPQCLLHGFQSPLQQIVGLSFCPIHGEPLISECPVCHCPSPRYGLDSNSFITPFHCHACGAPLAGSFDPALFFDISELRKEAQQAFSPIEKWLHKLDASPYRWPLSHKVPDLWFSEVLLIRPRHTNAQLQAFDVARRLVPLSLHRSVCVKPSRLVRVLVIPERKEDVRLDRYRMFPEHSSVAYTMKATYKAIRRYLFKRYVHHHKHCIPAPNLILGIGHPRGNDIVDFFSPACIVASSFILWRLRAEEKDWVLDRPPIFAKSEKWELRDAIYHLGEYENDKEIYFDLGLWAWSILSSFYSCLIVVTSMMRNTKKIAEIDDPKDKSSARFMNAHVHHRFLILDGVSRAGEIFHLTDRLPHLPKTHAFLYPDAASVFNLIKEDLRTQEHCYSRPPCKRMITRTQPTPEYLVV